MAKLSPLIASTGFQQSDNVRALAKDVETNSYILLALMEMSEISEAKLVFDWLITQRSSAGGFSTTQVSQPFSLIKYEGHFRNNDIYGGLQRACFFKTF